MINMALPHYSHYILEGSFFLQWDPKFFSYCLATIVFESNEGERRKILDLFLAKK